MHSFWRGFAYGLKAIFHGSESAKRFVIVLAASMCGIVACFITVVVGVIFMIHVGNNARGYRTVIDTVTGSGMAMGLIVSLAILRKLNSKLTR